MPYTKSMSTKSMIVKSFAVLFIAMLLAACGGSGAVNTATTQSGPTKITFWYGLGGHNGDVVRMLISKYNQSQSKYQIAGTFQSSYDDTLSKFNASVSGNSLPNVVQIYDIGTQRMIDTHKIVPVQDLIERDHLQANLDDIEPAIRSYYTIGGKLYSMPFNSSTAVMYYDKNAFKQAGLPTNQEVWTYDQILSAAKKLTTTDASGKIVHAGVAFYNYAWLFEQELAAHNALHSSPNNGRTSRATKYVFNQNPIGAQWLEFLKTLITSKTAFYYGNDSTSADASFSIGKAAITFDSIASLRGITTTVQKNGSKVDVGVAFLPRIAGVPQGRTIVGGASLWVTNTGTTAEQEGAWDFIKYTNRPDIQEFWSSNTGYIPVRLSAYKDPAMQTTLKQYPQFQVAVDELRAAPTNYFNAGSVTGTLTSTRNYIQQATDAYFNGKISTAQAALDQAAKQANTDLDEYNSANT
jgi:sn-glycerol 3-phosphate transport system substrate-binding protein